MLTVAQPLSADFVPLAITGKDDGDLKCFVNLRAAEWYALLSLCLLACLAEFVKDLHPEHLHAFAVA